MEQAALPEIGAISQAEIGAISQTEIGAISQNAMEDDCWKSTAVVDRDMMEEEVERVSWINFPDGNNTIYKFIKAFVIFSLDYDWVQYCSHADLGSTYSILIIATRLGVPYGERLLVAAEKGCTKLVDEIASQHPDAVNHKVFASFLF